MSPGLPEELALPPFRQRAPWWGGDLQTLRDTLRDSRLPDPQATPLQFPLPDGGALLGRLDLPATVSPSALVVLTHGLGGSSEAAGPRRLAETLRQEGLAVLRLNLRGAGEGRALASGSYAADCSADLLPVLRQVRRLSAELGSLGTPLPTLGAGISLGGTVLLNACIEAQRLGEAGLDALVCTSSPLDLPACSRQFERPRNGIYQRWLVERLLRQVQKDPWLLNSREQERLRDQARPRSIRQFDAAITAPRWGHASVDHYYEAASPLRRLKPDVRLPPTLLIQALDDPWVPAEPLRRLEVRLRREPGSLPSGLRLHLERHGGHNGFHAIGDTPRGCWSDRLTARWLLHQLTSGPEGSG